jgi:hypothetical protein
MSPVQYGASEDFKSAEREAKSTTKVIEFFRYRVSSQSWVTSPGKLHCVTLTMKAIRHSQKSITLSKHLLVHRCQVSEDLKIQQRC